MTFPLPRPARLAVFASGRGSNFAALLRAFPPGDPLASVVLCVSNKRSAGALSLAEQHGVAAHFVPFGNDRGGFEQEATRLLDESAADLVCLAGFMRVLSPEFTGRTGRYAGRILNVHPSLLPAFPGLHAQRQALGAGALESGCTVHFVDAGVDTGAAIVQRRVPVLPGDTEAALTARILAEEHRSYPEAVRLVLSGQVLNSQVLSGTVTHQPDGKDTNANIKANGVTA